MLQSAAQRNQMLQSLGNESQARIVVVLQSLLRDISLSIVVDDARKTAVQPGGGVREHGVIDQEKSVHVCTASVIHRF